MIRSRRSITLALATVALSLGAAACGDDDSTSSVASAALCDGVVRLDALPQVGSPEEASAYYQDLSGAVTAMQDDAPTDLVPSLEVLAGAVGDAVTTGELAVYGPTSEAAQLRAAASAVDAVAHEECAVNRLEVEAVDFAFAGLPSSLEAGRTSLRFVNVSAVEQHEMVLVRKADGVTESMSELVQLPEEEVGSKVSFVSAVMVDPGATAYLNTDLTPGDYGVICFIPVGGQPEGEPHFLHGMLADLTVTA